MAVDYETLRSSPRLLLEADLKPVQGDRFQPTGFPDLGPGLYERPDGTEMLLVESPQSMANRLERVCWSEEDDDLRKPLRGLPYVRIELDKGNTTNTILEAHRLNSPYIMVSKDSSFKDTLKTELAILAEGPIDLRKLSEVVFKYDPNSIIHGLFLARDDFAGGRLKLKRCLSAFIEAKGVHPAESGGTKVDRVDPSGKKFSGGKGAEKGFGNVPFHRTEFTAESTTAFFNLDSRQLLSYGLPEEAEELLLALALWKIEMFLKEGLRLRTACDFALQGEEVKEPSGYKLPEIEDLESAIRDSIEACKKKKLFADPQVTKVKFKT